MNKLTTEDLVQMMEEDFGYDGNDPTLTERDKKYLNMEKDIFGTILEVFMKHHVSYDYALRVLDEIKEKYLGFMCRV